MILNNYLKDVYLKKMSYLLGSNKKGKIFVRDIINFIEKKINAIKAISLDKISEKEINVNMYK
jgi:hypothetical protein